MGTWFQFVNHHYILDICSVKVTLNVSKCIGNKWSVYRGANAEMVGELGHDDSNL